MQPTDRGRQIMQMLLQMEKQFGKGSVLQLGSRNALPSASSCNHPPRPSAEAPWADWQSAATTSASWPAPPKGSSHGRPRFDGTTYTRAAIASDFTRLMSAALLML